MKTLKLEVQALTKLGLNKLDIKVSIVGGVIYYMNLDDNFTVLRSDHIKGSGVISIDKLKSLAKVCKEFSIEGGKVTDVDGVYTFDTDGENSFDMFTNIDNMGFKRIGNIDFTNIKDYKKHVSNDELREAMNYIYFDETNVVGTNAHTMLIRPHTLDISEPFLLSKGIANIGGDYDVYDSEFVVKFVNNDVKYYFRKSTLRFPNYQHVIPELTANTIDMKTKDLKRILNKTLISCNKVTNQAKFNILDSKLTIVSSDVDLNSKVNLSTNANINGLQNYSFKVNVKLLLNTLQITEDTIINYSEPTSPLYINNEILLMPLNPKS